MKSQNQAHEITAFAHDYSALAAAELQAAADRRGYSFDIPQIKAELQAASAGPAEDRDDDRDITHEEDESQPGHPSSYGDN